MRQQINFYNKIEREQKERLNAQLMLLSSAACLLLLLSISAFVAYGNVKVEQKTNSEQSDLVNLQQQLVELKQTRDKINNPAPLQLKIDRLKQQLIMKRMVLTELDDMPKSQQQGFSPYMSALVNQRLDGLWFTGLELHKGGAYISLIGKTKKPALVPAYLRMLSEESAYAGQQFNVFRISQPEKQRWLHDFEVRSEEKPIVESARALARREQARVSGGAFR